MWDLDNVSHNCSIFFVVHDPRMQVLTNPTARHSLQVLSLVGLMVLLCITSWRTSGNQGRASHLKIYLSVPGCAMALTQCHVSKVKVTVHTNPKWVSKQLLLTVMLDLDNISHNCCPCPKGVMTFHQGHILKVKVTVHPYDNPKSVSQAIAPYFHDGS